MRDPANEVVCPDCGATHHRYPAKLCRACEGEDARTRADMQRAWRRDR